eukprot:Sspe_Gene.39444::Locus_19029_Transcript_1_1_Confidence_1.000_Length_2398::g.39444::m.39444
MPWSPALRWRGVWGTGSSLRRTSSPLSPFCGGCWEGLMLRCGLLSVLSGWCLGALSSAQRLKQCPLQRQMTTAVAMPATPATVPRPPPSPREAPPGPPLPSHLDPYRRSARPCWVLGVLCIVSPDTVGGHQAPSVMEVGKDDSVQSTEAIRDPRSKKYDGSHEESHAGPTKGKRPPRSNNWRSDWRVESLEPLPSSKMLLLVHTPDDEREEDDIDALEVVRDYKSMYLAAKPSPKPTQRYKQYSSAGGNVQ